MTETVQDTYDDRYAAKLWSLVPAVYRAADSETVDGNGPLRELLNRLGVSVADVRRSIDRLWEDQSIETCDTWVIPYIAELLATNLVPSMDARGQRLDVANTIYYRRRKGTVALLEQLAHDVTGYEARVIEFFRVLGRNRHGLDPEIGRPASAPDPQAALQLQRAERLAGLLTGTPAGGWADLRNTLGATLSGTAFDEFHHRVDVRRGRGALGWYDIQKVGFFLWRTVALQVDRATPVPVSGCPGHFAFDPTGRLIPLFTAAARGANDYGESWLPIPIWQLPNPLTQPLWDAIAERTYPDHDAISIWGTSLSVSATASGDVVPIDDVKVWPTVGRFETLAGAPREVEVGYTYGLFSRIGAGPYDRRQIGAKRPVDPAPLHQVSGGSAITLVNGISALGATGTIEITDGLTISAVADPPLPVLDVTIRAADEKRAVIRTAPTPWVFTGGTDGHLRLEGLLVSGPDIILRGTFDEVTLSCCTFDPGTSGNLLKPPTVWASSVDGRDLAPTTIWVEGTVRSLVVERCITGPIRVRTGGLIEKLSAADSILQGLPTEEGGKLTHLRDADGMLSALHHQRDSLAVWLASELSPAAAAVVDAHADHTPVSDADAAQVAAALQTIIDGGLIYTAQRFHDRALRDSTLAAVAGNPTGPDLVALNRQLLAEAYPLALADAALATDEGVVELTRCTVLGPGYVHRLECSESVLDDVVRVQNAQDGCVRFSAWSTGSALPRRYESVQIAAGAPIMVSRRFGEWGFAQIHDGADSAILGGNSGGPPSLLTGSHDNSEMGVFCRDKAAIKDRSLLIKLKEYLPLGLSPVLIHLPEADPEGELTRGRPWPPM